LYARIAWAGRDHQSADAPWLDAWTEPGARVAWAASDARGRELDGALRAIADVRDERFERVVQAFQLDAAERDALQMCLAVAIDPTLAGVLAEAEGRAYVTEAAIARTFDHGLNRPVVADSPLRRWELVDVRDVGPGEPPALSIDPTVRDSICGTPRLDAALVGCARVIERHPVPSAWPVAALTQQIATQIGAGARVRVRVVGPPGLGRRTFAASVGEALGMAALGVDVDAVDADAWPLLHRRVQRQGYLDGVAPVWHGDALFERRWPQDVNPFPVQFVVADPGQEVPPSSAVVDHVVRLSPFNEDDRHELWRRAGAADWPHQEVRCLARDLHAVPGEIVAAMAARPASAAIAALAIREGARGRLGGLATWVECPFRWDDLIVSDAVRDTLVDFVFEARDRGRFWERESARRLFPQGRGLFALLSGPPGTGKSMAAQVVAAALGVDLFRVSLASVISRYVGETAKHLQRVLARAETMNAVLLFDEADTLFGKRTEIKDAHDRYANSDTNHLLQAVESYGGIAILASNKKASIDGAFLRRLRYVVELPRPEAADRCALWRRLVSDLGGAEASGALAAGLDMLGAEVELTGAQIKNAVLVGVFAARRADAPLGIRHLVRGVERELAKEGRSFNERQRARFVGG